MASTTVSWPQAQAELSKLMCPMWRAQQGRREPEKKPTGGEVKANSADVLAWNVTRHRASCYKG